MQIEKIKTIGDAYMAAAGVPLPRADHAGAMADFALAMLAALERVNAAAEVPFQMRVGIHTGPVVAGVIGSHRFLYDIWGDTVNLASRLESMVCRAGSMSHRRQGSCWRAVTISRRAA